MMLRNTTKHIVRPIRFCSEAAAPKKPHRLRRFVVSSLIAGTALEGFVLYQGVKYPDGNIRKAVDAVLPADVSQFVWTNTQIYLAPAACKTVRFFKGLMTNHGSVNDPKSGDSTAASRATAISYSFPSVEDSESSVVKYIDSLLYEADLSEKAIEDHKNMLRKVLKNQDTKSATDKDSVTNMWDEISFLYDKRKIQEQNFNSAYEKADQALDRLRNQVKSNGDSANDTIGANVRTILEQTIKDSAEKMESAKKRIDTLSKDSSEWKEFEEKQKLFRRKLQTELQALVPSFRLSPDKASQMSPAEQDQFVNLVYQRIVQLNSELERLKKSQDERVKAAVREEAEKWGGIRDAAVAQAVSQEKLEGEKLSQISQGNQQLAFGDELRAALAKQSAAHTDHLNAVLAIEKDRMQAQMTRDLQKQLLHERSLWTQEVQDWIDRLNKYEKSVDTYRLAEEAATNSRQLWLATLSLSQKIKGMPSSNSPVDVARSLQGIWHASASHPFVRDIILQITPKPDNLSSHNVYNEATLKRRFEKLKKVANMVALVDYNGAPLWVWLASAVQSFFVRDTKYFAGFPGQGLKLKRPKPVPVESATVHFLMSKAAKALDDDDWFAAVNYLSQLGSVEGGGMAARVAFDWIKDARRFAELRLLTSTVSIYAQAAAVSMQQK